MQTRFLLNGAACEREVDGDTTLLDLLGGVGLIGTKAVCAEGDCGACGVLLDGLPVNACLVPAGSCRDRRVETIESFAADGVLHPLQRGLIEAGLLRCGYCAPAWLIALKGLLDAGSEDGAALEATLRGIICRCGPDVAGLAGVLRAVAAGAGANP